MQYEDIERKAIWEENMRLIEKNNQGFFKGTTKFIMAINKYGDMVFSFVILFCNCVCITVLGNNAYFNIVVPPVQTSQEYKSLQGALTNDNLRRGKNASARKLSSNARALGAVSVDYRTTGLVTEVKDQVRVT